MLKHGFEVALGRIMPVLVTGSAVTIGAVVVVTALTSRGPVLILPGLALLPWIGVIVVTLRYNAPVNRLAVSWDSAAPPGDWEALRDKWHKGQTLRTPLAVSSFVALVQGVLWPQLVQ